MTFVTPVEKHVDSNAFLGISEKVWGYPWGFENTS